MMARGWFASRLEADRERVLVARAAGGEEGEAAVVGRAAMPKPKKRSDLAVRHDPVDVGEPGPETDL